MKRILIFVLLCCSSSVLFADPTATQEGIIVRMRLVVCPAPSHGFMVAMSGSARVGPQDPCPEYTLLTEKIAYIVIGRASNQLVPLAEVTKFRFQNREMLIRVDDSKRESHFMIKEMMLRSEWERHQRREDEELRSVSRREPDPDPVGDTR